MCCNRCARVLPGRPPNIILYRLLIWTSLINCKKQLHLLQVTQLAASFEHFCSLWKAPAPRRAGSGACRPRKRRCSRVTLSYELHQKKQLLTIHSYEPISLSKLKEYEEQLTTSRAGAGLRRGRELAAGQAARGRRARLGRRQPRETSGRRRRRVAGPGRRRRRRRLLRVRRRRRRGRQHVYARTHGGRQRRRRGSHICLAELELLGREVGSAQLALALGDGPWRCAHVFLVVRGCGAALLRALTSASSPGVRFGSAAAPVPSSPRKLSGAGPPRRARELAAASIYDPNKNVARNL